MIIGEKIFDFSNKTYIMGILNVTPDSFSDGGRDGWNNIDSLLYKTEQMIKDGADIIDIGGQTTKPGYKEVETQVEIERVLPVISAIKKNFSVPISVDTYRAQVAKEAILVGADIINDVFALLCDPEMMNTVKDSNIPYCITHSIKTNSDKKFVDSVILDFKDKIDIMEKFGIEKNRLIIDPGVGFEKSATQSIDVISNIKKFCEMGFPVLIGVSKKSFMDKVYKSAVDERLEMTLAANIFSIMNGCAIIRVHDVLAHKKALMMIEALKGINRG